MDGLTVLIFGQLEEVTGSSRVELPYMEDTEALCEALYARFPALKDRTFRIAMNNKLVSSNVAIQAGTEIALLPPFSGG